MHQPRSLRLTASILLCFVVQALGADKYTDENRPYEFGFKIDGEQHRHESKDKDGIVMGEFGFVTADDVYHVTVYATDKEGRFKILSMKNIHLKSTARQAHALALPPAQPASIQASVIPQQPPKQGGVSTPAQLGLFSPLAAQVSQGPIVSQLESPYKPVSIEPPRGSCSSCSLPSTTTRAPPPVLNQFSVAGNNNYNSPNQFGQPNPLQNQQAFPSFAPGQQNIGQRRQQSFPPLSSEQQTFARGGPESQNIPQQGLVAPNSAPSFTAQPGPTAQISVNPQSYSQGPVASNAPINNIQSRRPSASVGPIQGGNLSPDSNQAALFSSNESLYPVAPGGFANSVPNGQNLQNVQQYQPLFEPNTQPNGQSPTDPQGPRERTAKQYNLPQGPNGSTKPTLVSAQMQIVDKNTDIYALGPNEQKGLPPGLTEGYITQLLYTFNYTVGFHGHFEEGYTNGVKKGYYFVTGRNGVKTRIDYVADDTGFHPKVSQDVLDLLSEDVPKPETEKDAKYGLKGYEFKWLYYPVESKRQ